MAIQWYPGHMAKAKRQMIEKIKQIDVVIELVDSRVPMSSRNPLVDEIATGKPRLLLMNKMDMADRRATKAWQNYFEGHGLKVHLVNSQTGQGVSMIPEAVRQLTATRRKKLEDKGFRPHADRALILGIPNVGKSTLINRLAGKKIAKIGDRPGVTTAQQWIKVGKTMELLDTPGILWPKFDDPQVGLRLAATGAIKEELLDFQEIAFFLIKTMLVYYREAFAKRFQLTDLPELDGVDDQNLIIKVFDQIGKKRGCLMSGGMINYDRVSELIIRDFRGQKIGPLTLEWP
ncbi:ribosome biogenesis GTPase YlqF [Sporolactobacillus terrae]|uniref:Ribosome biogenesis GTPase A n=1 Tax=Sporolactobacillus terrae TaxID=269673 RepID=A0A410D8C9_9BACL|nr:ribosome biogenesis GTPase YlqF [Sporolactobacillus terrae]QAA22327.1 ribosome biogenesis GTPase YlqF [Sporolactobacillus terrae]QAA25303.1 ribosome biogenesis GTPase YlqF [Sporolactobacillus terrae]UAK17114.1 ribosome biogenesis GTPase YlqF [Sporolactobacillus terrae]BBN98642.1 ribosome biogenesis GTPase A [Sporolactobacillus terrae]